MQKDPTKGGVLKKGVPNGSGRFGTGGLLNFERLALTSRDAFYHYDLDRGEFLFVNPAFLGFFGLSPGDEKGLSLEAWLECLSADDRSRAREVMTVSAASEEESGRYSYRAGGPDGRSLQDSWNLIRDESGRPRAVEGIIFEAEPSLAGAEEIETGKYRAPIGIYIVQDGEFKHVNPEFIQNTGYTAEELMGMDPLDLVHPDYKIQVRNNAVSMLKGDRTEPYEFCVIDKQGRVKWVLETVTSINYHGRQAALGYFMDITKRREARHNLASLGLMIGAVSHSLKGCLTGLDAALYLIDTGFYRETPARIEEGLDTAKLMVDRLEKLVRDVLYYAKERELELEEVDVLQFANDLVSGVANRMRGADIDFTCRYKPPLGTFRIDRDLVRPALLNILENALEACIEDSSRSDHQVEFIVGGGMDAVEIEIKDNGPGLDAEGVKNAFNLFYSSKGKKGSGLGLFITKRVIDQHGGRVGVESDPEKGTSFFITLPRRVGSGRGRGLAMGVGAMT